MRCPVGAVKSSWAPSDGDVWVVVFLFLAFYMFLLSKAALESLHAEIRAADSASCIFCTETPKTPGRRIAAPAQQGNELAQSSPRVARALPAAFSKCVFQGSAGVRLPARQGKLPRCRAGFDDAAALSGCGMFTLGHQCFGVWEVVGCSSIAGCVDGGDREDAGVAGELMCCSFIYFPVPHLFISLCLSDVLPRTSPWFYLAGLVGSAVCTPCRAG